jgi:hypothetical protein
MADANQVRHLSFYSHNYLTYCMHISVELYFIPPSLGKYLLQHLRSLNCIRLCIFTQSPLRSLPGRCLASLNSVKLDTKYSWDLSLRKIYVNTVLGSLLEFRYIVLVGLVSDTSHRCCSEHIYLTSVTDGMIIFSCRQVRNKPQEFTAERRPRRHRT